MLQEYFCIFLPDDDIAVLALPPLPSIQHHFPQGLEPMRFKKSKSCLSKPPDDAVEPKPPTKPPDDLRVSKLPTKPPANDVESNSKTKPPDGYCC